MKANFGAGMEKTWKKDHSPVTKTDIAINKLVINQVKKHYPTHGVLGEEASYKASGREYLWVCDPVDGTVPFSHGIPTFVFSLALVRGGKPILGVIYDTILDKMYTGVLGRGAFLNGRKIRVKSAGLIDAIGFWDVKTVGKLNKKYPRVFWLNLYSIGYEGISVASGNAVCALYDYHFAHDIAALKVILEEAGGKVTDKNGKEQRYDGRINGALISNGKVHKELLKMIR